LHPVTDERGYVIPAFNTAEVDYDLMARRLSDSLWNFHPNANIRILSNLDISKNLGGYANDVHAYHLSPYRQTIKLEADMLIASPIEHWWAMFEHRDVVISTGCRDFYDRPAESRFYRRVFDENNLPDVYNAISYWRRSHLAHEFVKVL
jgi:hypothetical protein